MSKKCPICNSISYYVFTSRHNKNIYHCQNNSCKHFFTPVIDFNQGLCKRSHDIEAESNNSLKIFRKRNSRLIKVFEKKINGFDGKRILDFGAGDAHISRTLKNFVGKKSDIYCFEPNPLCEGFYKKYGLIQLHDLNNLNFEIDFIYMVEVIEHLIDPIAELRKLREKISSDGVLFISTPLGNHIEYETNAYDTVSHLHFFTQKSLNLALSMANFSSINSTHIPEMYPNKFDRGFCRGFLIMLLNLIRPKRSYGHLVGFSNPEGKVVKS